jgi:hypothetical protein
MAIETTPLGFQKPDGNELVKQGDNVIAYNADVADGLLTNQDFRIASIEALAEPPAPTGPRPVNLAFAPDGVPYILAGANEVTLYFGTDGNVYFEPKEPTV